MKARRAEPKQEFVPVIVTLESQEEVDSLFSVINHTEICIALPALDDWYDELKPFTSKQRHPLWDRLNNAIN